MSGGEGEAKAKGGLVHQIFRWLFIGFNALMAIWLVSYVVGLEKLKTAAVTVADKDALGLATQVFAGMLLGLWLFGAVLLGLLSSLTKPKVPSTDR